MRSPGDWSISASTLGRREREPMKSSPTKLVMAVGLITVGVALAAAGVFIGEIDDAPGAALIGILLMIGMVALGVKTARRRA